jgi:hypothetical protein
MDEDAAVFTALVNLDGRIDRIAEMPADTLRGLVFMLVLGERFRRGLQ